MGRHFTALSAILLLSSVALAEPPATQPYKPGTYMPGGTSYNALVKENEQLRARVAELEKQLAAAKPAGDTEQKSPPTPKSLGIKTYVQKEQEAEQIRPNESRERINLERQTARHIDKDLTDFLQKHSLPVDVVQAAWSSQLKVGMPEELFNILCPFQTPLAEGEAGKVVRAKAWEPFVYGDLGMNDLRVTLIDGKISVIERGGFPPPYIPPQSNVPEAFRR